MKNKSECWRHIGFYLLLLPLLGIQTCADQLVEKNGEWVSVKVV